MTELSENRRAQMMARLLMPYGRIERWMSRPTQGTVSREQYEKWMAITDEAVESVKDVRRRLIAQERVTDDELVAACGTLDVVVACKQHRPHRDLGGRPRVREEGPLLRVKEGQTGVMNAKHGAAKQEWVEGH